MLSDNVARIDTTAYHMDRYSEELFSIMRIPMKPAIDSETKPATCSDFIPASIPI